jgi:hypothetical protein
MSSKWKLFFKYLLSGNLSWAIAQLRPPRQSQPAPDLHDSNHTGLGWPKE